MIPIPTTPTHSGSPVNTWLITPAPIICCTHHRNQEEEHHHAQNTAHILGVITICQVISHGQKTIFTLTKRVISLATPIRRAGRIIQNTAPGTEIAIPLHSLHRKWFPVYQEMSPWKTGLRNMQYHFTTTPAFPLNTKKSPILFVLRPCVPTNKCHNSKIKYQNCIEKESVLAELLLLHSFICPPHHKCDILFSSYTCDNKQ